MTHRQKVAPPARRALSRLRRMRVLLACALGLTLLAALALPVLPERAAAEPVTVPYIDRLGCGADDATVTPVFSWAGSGIATNGALYSPTTAASSYPAPSASFSGVTGNPGYTTYSPAGYGSDFQYRGTSALGFPSVTAGLGATLTVQLPHPQTVQFTVGGIQQPSRAQITGTGPAGAIVPAAEARATAAGSATVVTSGSSVQVVGAVDDGSGDGIPRTAVDVWFTAPVSTITVTLSTNGSGTDAGFLVTAPTSCQSGTVTTDATVRGATVDAAAGRISHEVSMVTTVRNSSPAFGAVLYPSVSAPLRAAAEAQGMTLDAISATASSSAACAASAGLDGTGALIDPGSQGLAPGTECTLAWTAILSMPQSTADRTVELDSGLRSSGTTAARLKSQTSTALLFPGLVSDLSISDSGAGQALPGQRVTRSATITNRGEGAAIGTAYVLSAPAEATLSGLPAGCTTDGLSANCYAGNIAPGATATIGYALTVDSSASPGTTLSLTAGASSSAQATPAALTYSLSVIAAPEAPPIGPPVEPPVQRLRSPETTPSPVATTSPIPLIEPPSLASPDRVPVPMSLSFAGAEITPGTVSTLRGTLGPVESDQPVAISLSGRINQGMVYRLARILIDDQDTDSCVTQTREFSCAVTLRPGERAQIELRVFADALNAPDQVVQQLTLSTGDSSGDNSSTVTTAVASDSGSSDTDEWTSAFTLDMSTLDDAFLPLTAMMLLALAATVAERRRP